MIPKNWWNVANLMDEQERTNAIGLFLKDVYSILSHGWTFQDNAKGALLNVTFTVANSEVKIRHGLDFVPTNYLLCGGTAAMSLYDGVTAADKQFFYLRSSAIGVARVFVF